MVIVCLVDLLRWIVVLIYYMFCWLLGYFCGSYGQLCVSGVLLWYAFVVFVGIISVLLDLLVCFVVYGWFVCWRCLFCCLGLLRCGC